MNKNLNLVDILKDCPKGTKLYSTIHGEVEFVEIRNNRITNHPIIYKYKDNDGNYYMNSTTIDGKFDISSNGECILFPAKDQRDWSKFNIEPKFDISTFQHFDRVLVRDCNTQNWKCDFYDSRVKERLLFRTIISWYRQCVPYNNETEHLVDTTEMPPKKYITWEE
jgi:hypothetical protein